MPITINGSGTVTGISAGGLPDGVITTDDIAAGAVTQAKRSEQLTLGTAQASTSGTSIDFTGIPSWVKRVTVMFDGVSTNGTSFLQVQAGTSGGILTSGYAGTSINVFSVNSIQVTNHTSGIVFAPGASAADARTGHCILTLISGNLWIASSTVGSTTSTTFNSSGFRVPLSGTLDRIRITTVNGTDTFDAGSINILYE